jgi:hypothetical protein
LRQQEKQRLADEKEKQKRFTEEREEQTRLAEEREEHCCIEATAVASVGDFFGGVIGVVGGVFEEKCMKRCTRHLFFSPLPQIFLTGYPAVFPQRSEVQLMEGAVSVSDLACKLQ